MSIHFGDRGNQSVSLGCGTLILIAIIVLIFSGSGEVSDLKREVGEVRQEVAELQQKVDELTALLRERLPERANVGRESDDTGPGSTSP